MNLAVCEETCLHFGLAMKFQTSLSYFQLLDLNLFSFVGVLVVNLGLEVMLRYNDTNSSFCVLSAKSTCLATSTHPLNKSVIPSIISR